MESSGHKALREGFTTGSCAAAAALASALRQRDSRTPRRVKIDTPAGRELTLDVANESVTKNGERLNVTAKEFELLSMLISNKGQTLTKEMLFDRIWGSDSESEPQTLTVHIKWLRQKIESDPKNPTRIITVWGKGYRWEG